MLFRRQGGHSIQLGQKADARDKLAAIDNEADLQLGEANNEACLPLGEPNTFPVGGAAHGEANVDQVDSFADCEMGSRLGPALQSCAQGLAEERT